MATKFFNDFTNQYSVSKTLRFELVPIGQTLKNIEKKGLINKDTERAESYKKLKKTIDEYHKHFIEMALRNVQLTRLNDYYELYSQTKENRNEDDFKKIKTDLRKEIAQAFNAGDAKELYKRLFGKELIKEDLEEWINKQESCKELHYDEGFKNFTTYFTGFNENRKNMYSEEEKSTAIAYRIIHENLPKFIENIKIFNLIKEKHPELDFSPIYSEMEEVIQGRKLEDIFTLDFFNNLLTQKWIEFINFIIGGKTPEKGNKIKGLNEYINLYNQQQKDKKNKIPKFKQLYKQILSDRSSISLRYNAFENDNDLLEAIEYFYNSELCEFENEGNKVNVFEKIKDLIENIENYELNRLYIRNDLGLTNISQRIFGIYSVFKDSMSFYYDNFIDLNYQEKLAKADTEKKIKGVTDTKRNWNKDFISIGLLQDCLDKYINTLDDEHEIKKKYTGTDIIDYFKKHSFKLEDAENSQQDNELFYSVISQYRGVKGFLNSVNNEDNFLIQDKERVHQLKSFLDSILDVIHFIKPIHIPEEAVSDKDENFYSHFNPFFDQLNKFIPLYNMVRNHLTKKPYSKEKIKLNFENSTLLDGWDVNKEPDNYCVLLLKDDQYYLGIMQKGYNRLFIDQLPNDGDCYKKIVYKQVSDAAKDIHTLVNINGEVSRFTKGLNEKRMQYCPEIQEIKEKESYKGANSVKKDLFKFIDYYKVCAKSYWNWCDFNFKETDKYSNIKEFTDDINKQGYKIKFIDVSEAYINQCIAEDKLYLFKIHNKDFSPYSKGKPNLHTLYWRALFDENNLKDVIYKLNGQAEVFFRKKSILEKNIINHKAGEILDAKNLLTPNATSTFDYDIIKDKRFTVDKFHFHVPITLNFKASGGENINTKVNTFLQNNPDVNIIGLDRGERHLIYLTIIDQQGNILIQESLNTIINEARNIETPYHTLLHEREQKRDKARKSWDTVENIKELKEGYVSQVVHKIAEMMIKYNAIVVMEDLNFGFKRGRFKVEKQVYQKLEKMLIDKLNYLIFKDFDENQNGGLYKALQLTNKFESFKKLGKQSGFLFYVPASFTSKIDPVTGFTNFLYPKYENISKAKDFFEKFDYIKFNIEEDYFEFAFDYNNFTGKAEGLKSDWVVCTHCKDRYRYNPQTKTSEIVDVTAEIKLLFEKNSIKYDSGQDIKDLIVASESKEVFTKLLHLLSLTLSMRQSKTGTDIDYIISPVKDKNGVFYDSRKADKTLPKDADANGAYHIALKGLWCLQQIDKATDFKKLKLAISNKEWLEFVQKK
jgi:CRISPR-associated protein Cpf1